MPRITISQVTETREFVGGVPKKLGVYCAHSMADPTSSNLETLQQIWQGVFQRSPVGVSDDFFDLGGDAWLAAELMTAINNQTSVDLPATVICNAPTVGELASAVQQPQFSGAAILLKQSAAQSAPIFMLHGVGSSVVDLVPPVRRMQVDLPIYGLEAKGNDGRESPLDRIEDIAQSFLAAIREIQAHGPYFLVGYSLGGLIALEIAQQMRTKSEEIGLLVMIDSYPDRRFLSFAQSARLVLQRAKNRVMGRKNTSPVKKRPLVQSSNNQRHSLVQAMQRTRDANYRALRSYRPGFYEGEVKFVRAAIPTHFSADPVPVWAPFVRRLEVETIPGEHVTMLRGSIGPLASLLDEYVRESCAKQQV
jgi:thioesterase domain-containing protein